MNASADLHADVCVVGGGPAGAACALRLAQLGHDVLLVERAPRGRPHVGESLPPSVLPWLDQLGVRGAVEAAGFLRPRGALVQWDGGLRDSSDEAGGEPGFQVDRARFDALLLEAAGAAGANVLHGIPALTPLREAQGVRVPLADGRVVLARWLVQATGRRAGEHAGVRTAALYAYWDGHGIADPRTRVEAGDEAWYWGAPLPNGSFNATVFVDAARCTGMDPVHREAWYRALLAQSRLLAPCLQGRPREAVRVCDATPRQDPQPIDERVLKVGEAAFSIDPLSSQGVQAALRSAWQAAACVHTMAHRPESIALAIAFYREQVQAAAARHARLAGGFHAAAARARGTAFWRARAGAAGTEVRSPPPLPALDALLRLDPTAGWRRVPSLQGPFIVEAQALVHPALEQPMSQLGPWPLARLLSALREPRPVAELLRVWGAECGDEAAVQMLTLLWRQGIVGSAA